MKILHKEFVTSACGCQSCVNNKEELIFSIYNGKVVYFCNEDCKEEFDEDPAGFIESDHFRITLDQLDDLKYENEN